MSVGQFVIQTVRERDRNRLLMGLTYTYDLLSNACSTQQEVNRSWRTLIITVHKMLERFQLTLCDSDTDYYRESPPESRDSITTTTESVNWLKNKLKLVLLAFWISWISTSFKEGGMTNEQTTESQHVHVDSRRLNLHFHIFWESWMETHARKFTTPSCGTGRVRFDLCSLMQYTIVQ